MTRVLVSIATAALILGAQTTADAATRKARAQNQFDGSWAVTSVTKNGSCPASTSYQARIKDSKISVPGQAVDIAGGVSAGGAVQATITKGSTKVPITGRLKRQGSGSGTWSTSGGLLACSGSWSAKRSG